MIGFIAGGRGIVVRNSMVLLDFIELQLKQGMPLDQAVVDVGAERFRPIMLTAAAVVVGSVVILFDPIFQGLAIALMAGEIASLSLSCVTVPIEPVPIGVHQLVPDDVNFAETRRARLITCAQEPRQEDPQRGCRIKSARSSYWSVAIRSTRALMAALQRALTA